jgi:hypothetical protein
LDILHYYFVDAGGGERLGHPVAHRQDFFLFDQKINRRHEGQNRVKQHHRQVYYRRGQVFQKHFHGHQRAFLADEMELVLQRGHQTVDANVHVDDFQLVYVVYIGERPFIVCCKVDEKINQAVVKGRDHQLQNGCDHRHQQHIDQDYAEALVPLGYKFCLRFAKEPP